MGREFGKRARAAVGRVHELDQMGFGLAVALFCFNFISDGLRDAFDPKDR
jgi:ABC-type dipeptide/oligopeptide/nickel transport system permease subunit